MNTINNEIDTVRFGIVRAFLITLSIIALPALLASLSRVFTIGWQPLMSVHIIIAAVLWVFTLLNQRIPYIYLASYIIFMFLIIGIGGLLQFSLVAGGIVFLTMASPIAALLFNVQAGFIVLVLTVTASVIIALLNINGAITHTFDFNEYVISSTSWLNAIIGWTLATASLTASLHFFNSKLIDSLNKSKQHERELSDYQKTLEQTLREKDKLLSEVKQLQGIIPICSYCHKIRTDEGAWNQLEKYISEHSEAVFSHSICPNCLPRVREEAGLDSNN